MQRKGGLRGLDDRLLGSTVIAIIAGLVTLYLVVSGIGALLDHALITALVYLVLGVACGQAAVREWRRRSK